jgi:tetratricopeptide (TPR) repeat protein
MRDVLTSAGARIALAQALNVRFFAYGVIQQTASFNVSTHLIDAETGARHGGGDIHVQDHQELKLRMNELVKQTVAKPEEQAKLQQAGKENEKLLSDARKQYESGKYTEAAATSREGLKRMPNSVAFQQLLQQSEQALQKAALEDQRKQELAKRQAETAAAQMKQQELAKQAELARKKAEDEAKTKDAAARRAQEQEKLRAFGTLVAQAREASQKGNYPQAVSLLQSAASLQPSDSVNRDLAQAKAKVEETRKAQLALEQAAKEAALKKQRERELAQAKAKVEEERKRREAEEVAHRKETEARDNARAAALVEKGKQLLAKQQFDAALATLSSARQLHRTDEVDKLLVQASEGKAKAEAEKKGAQAKAELERKLAEEKAQREKSEAEAKRKQDAYLAALNQAQKALVEKHYDDAIARYQEADKLFHTDAVISGLKQAQDAKTRSLAQADVDKHKLEEQKRAEAERQKRLTEEQKPLESEKQKQVAADKAKADAEAKMAADKAKAQAEAKMAAEKARADAEARKKKEEEKKRLDDVYERFMKEAQAALAAKRYDAAAKAYADALKVMPGDGAATKGHREALALQQAADKAKAETQTRMEAEARKKEEEKKRLADYGRLMTQGQTAISARKYDDAVKAYGDALKLMPGDPVATRALADANKSLEASKTPKPPSPPPPPPAAYTRAMQNAATFEKQQRWSDAVAWYKEALKAVPGDAKATKGQDFGQHMDNAKKHAVAKKFPDAVKEYEAALKLIPDQPDATVGLKRAKEGKP